MKNCVQDTIHEIECLHAEMAALRANLLGLFRDEVPLPKEPIPELARRAEPANPVKDGKKGKDRKKVARDAKQQKSRNHVDGSRASALEGARNMVAKARGLREPFGSGDLVAATGCELGKAQQALWRWESRAKWVRRVAPGQFVRTEQFPPVDAGVAERPGDVAERLRTARARLALAEANHELVEAGMQRELIRELEGWRPVKSNY